VVLHVWPPLLCDRLFISAISAPVYSFLCCHFDHCMHVGYLSFTWAWLDWAYLIVIGCQRGMDAWQGLALSHHRRPCRGLLSGANHRRSAGARARATLRKKRTHRFFSVGFDSIVASRSACKMTNYGGCVARQSILVVTSSIPRPLLMQMQPMRAGVWCVDTRTRRAPRRTREEPTCSNGSIALPPPHSLAPLP